MTRHESVDSQSESELSDNWWSRPCGVREVLLVAIPLVVSTMSYTVMQFCDRIFLTWYSNLDLAAVVPAGALSWTLMSLPLGVAVYANTFVAQYFGANHSRRIGPLVWQTVWIGLATVPLFIGLGFWLYEVFDFGHSPELVAREAAYFKALSFGSGFAVLSAGLSAFFIGRGKTGVIMAVDLFAASLNVVLDYFFIFGLAINGQEWIVESGISGAGWATTISIWIKTGLLMALFLLPGNRREFGTGSGWQLNSGQMRSLLKYGLPNGFQFLIEGAAITAFILIIARISNLASAATALAFSVNMIVFVPVLGIGIATSTLVGQQIGRGKPALASRATWSALWISLVYTGLFAVSYVAVPEWFLAAHNVGSQEFDDIEEMAVWLLSFVAVYCLFDTIQLIFVSAIKGAGDTLFVVINTIVTSAIFLFAGFRGARYFSSPEQQVYYWWACLTGWILLLSLVYGVRFLRGKWRSMTVIASELIENGIPPTMDHEEDPA